jgi:hypothetical protein
MAGRDQGGMPSSIGGSGSTSNQSNFGSNNNGGTSGGGLFKSFNLNPNAVMQAKLYEFKTPDKTYRLALIVSNLFSSGSQPSQRYPIARYYSKYIEI